MLLCEWFARKINLQDFLYGKFCEVVPASSAAVGKEQALMILTPLS